MAEENHEAEFNMDPAALCKEEVFTDRRVGTITRMTPITGDGERDESRPVEYIGQTQIMTRAGALPISFQIEADTLGEAAQKFGEGAEQAVEDTMRRIQEMQREAATSIVTPETGGFGGMGGGAPGGPGSKIQLR